MDFWTTPAGWTLVTLGEVLLVTVGVLLTLVISFSETLLHGRDAYSADAWGQAAHVQNRSLLTRGSTQRTFYQQRGGVTRACGARRGPLLAEPL